MRYTQKDVCRAFDIKRDTLRHYERLGIIEPEVAENGYRYYDDWQINLLWVQKRVSERERQLKHDLAYQAMGLESLASFREMIEGVEERMGAFALRELPEARFVPRREVHDLLLDERLREAGRFVNENQAICLPPVAHFPVAQGERYYWGLAMLSDRYIQLGGPEEGYVTLPAGRALTTCVDAGERWNFGQALFQGLLDEAERLGEQPLGMLYGFLLTRTYDEAGGYHRYVEAVLPLEG